MSISEGELRALKRFLKDSSFTYTDEWLLACVSWVYDNYTTVNGEVLKRQIVEQWKDANLEDMESSCLPPNLKEQRLVTLPGKYGLQVNSVRDIGESSYSQWNKVKKLENENTTVAADSTDELTQTWQPKLKRCLYLDMTDGSQQVFGLEMEFNPGLSLNMKPGVKVIVVGPVDCRRGVIHLKPNNLRIIGGEVEDFQNTNKVDRILAKILNISDDKLTQTQTQRTAPPPIRTQPAAAISNQRGGNEELGDFPDSGDPFNDDDIFMEIDEEALLNSASTSNATTQVVGSSRNITQRTTQGVDESFPNVDEIIEDYDDDPPPAVTSRPIASAKTSSAGTTNNKTKPAFLPPSVVPKPSVSSLKQSDKSIVASIASDKTVVGPSAFRSAKTAVNNNNSKTSSKSTVSSSSSSSSSSTTGTQIKILQYLKPMPVVIDPPTPQRQTKRRKKTGEEDTKIKMESNDDDKVTNMQETEIVTAEEQGEEEAMTMDMHDDGGQNDSNDEEDVFYFNQTPDADDSLMQIVDETIESKLSTATETLQDSKTKSKPATSSTLAPDKKFPIIVSDQPYVFLMQVQENLEELAEKRKIVFVKACISTVVSNIKVDNGCWTLTVCLNDGTGYLNCKISSDILDSIIGFTPQEMKRMKAAKTAEGKAKIAEGMGGLVKKLVHMNAMIAIELGEEPLIVDIRDVLLHHSTAMKDRLRQIYE